MSMKNRLQYHSKQRGIHSQQTTRDSLKANEGSLTANNEGSLTANNEGSLTANNEGSLTANNEGFTYRNSSTNRKKDRKIYHNKINSASKHLVHEAKTVSKIYR